MDKSVATLSNRIVEYYVTILNKFYHVIIIITHVAHPSPV